jgi:hypothetical protein
LCCKGFCRTGQGFCGNGLENGPPGYSRVSPARTEILCASRVRRAVEAFHQDRNLPVGELM